MAVDYRILARRKARKYGVPEAVFERQIGAESGFNPRAVSPAGARGIAQIMPATARGWGVNPDDPVAALDAAAKNMARYIKAYGLEGALRAYNAGPGAIEKSKGYRETNNYVRKILGGLGSQDRRPSRSRSSSPGTPGTPSRTVTTTTNTFDAEGFRKAQGMQLLAQMIAKRRGPQGVLFKSGLLSTADPDPSQFRRESTSQRVIPGTPARPASRQPSGGGGRRRRGELLEMFHDPGINIDNGRETRPIGGHGSHVHAAFKSKTALLEAARLAQRMGLRVGENPYFGGVAPVHTKGSFHDQRYPNSRVGMAIDVSGDPKKLREYNRRLASRYR